MAVRVHAMSSALAALLLVGAANVALGDNACPSAAGPVAIGNAQWNGWGLSLDNTRYQPEPAIRASDVAKLAVKWAYGYPSGTEFGQPTVVDERLFVTSSTGRIYSFDAKTGCTYWTYDAAAGSQTAVVIGELARARVAALPKRLKRTLAHLDVIKAPSAAFFGDDTGAVYALDAQKGTLLWKTQVDARPQARIIGAPTLYHGRLYVVLASNEQSAAADGAYACCTSRGSVAALDMATGHLLWKTYVIREDPRPYRSTAAGQELGPAGAGVAGAPTIDGKRNLIYLGTGGSLTEINQPLADAVLALDMSSGQVRWAKQFSRHDKAGGADFISSPILRTLADGKQIILAGQKSGIVYALDPDHGGDVLWQTKVAEDSVPAGIEWGPAADHRRLYVALSGLVAEPDNTSGGLAALDMKTGTKRWYAPAPAPACSWGPQACSHAEAQAVTVIPGAAF